MEENTQEEVQQEAPQVEEPSVTTEPVVSDDADVEKNKGMAILAYFLFFIPMLTDAKNSKFAMFHANQSLVLLIFSTVGWIVSSMLAFILIGFLLMPLVGIVSLVFWIMGIINAATGKTKELPLIGGIHILDKE